MGVERRILVIGVDGATFDVVGPLVDKGMLPNLGRLMRDGCYGKLLSTIPTLSPVAWTSFATGKNCGKHGIFDFVRRGPGSYRMLVNNASWRRSKPIWVILSERGRSVCVVNVPMSYPPDEVNGYMISGLGTPGTSRDFTYPTWLYEEIRREIGEYIVTPDLHVKMREKISAKEVQDVVEVLSNCIDIRTEAVKYLMKKQSSEFIMVMFGETDLISHMFWESDIEKVICEGSNAIYEIYEKIDN
ncbi:MAG: alkaline phosphatase family protein, partial [Candidatus Thorarchaeota archaeon]